MAKGRRETVSNAAEILVHEGTIAVVKNRDGALSVDLGGSDVTAGGGYELKFGESITVDARTENVYAIRSGAGDVRVDVLEVRGLQY